MSYRSFACLISVVLAPNVKGTTSKRQIKKWLNRVSVLVSPARLAVPAVHLPAAGW